SRTRLLFQRSRRDRTSRRLFYQRQRRSPLWTIARRSVRRDLGATRESRQLRDRRTRRAPRRFCPRRSRIPAATISRILFSRALPNYRAVSEIAGPTISKPERVRPSRSMAEFAHGTGA